MSGDFTVPKDVDCLRLLCWVLGDSEVFLDDLVLESVDAKGAGRPLVARTRQDYMSFLSQWVRLYHGEGRDWLAHGRHLRPPRFRCAREAYDFNFRGEGRARTDMPAVFCASYESLDGRKAHVFGNATRTAQPCAYFEAGEWKRLTLGPAELRLVRLP